MTAPIYGVTPTAYAATSTTPATEPTATTGSTATGTGSTSDSQSLLNPAAFLQLLVAQLQYQDPTNPTDTSTFMNQTAMLSQVQTMNSMSSTLQSLVGEQQTQAATSMIGKQITYLDATGAQQSGIATAAQLSSTGASLTVGDAVVPLANVTTVTAPPAAS